MERKEGGKGEKRGGHDEKGVVGGTWKWSGAVARGETPRPRGKGQRAQQLTTHHTGTKRDRGLRHLVR